MNPYKIRNTAKEVLKAAFKIPRNRSLKRTADLYSSTPIDISDLSPKNSKTVKKYINKRAFGSEDVDFFSYIKKAYGSGIEHAASLGAHHGNFERDLVKRGIVKNMDCYELSGGAIDVARKLANDEGLNSMRFLERNLNKMEFDRKSYGAVFAFKSLHHVENLEGLFENVVQVLKPNGYFFIDDFFGPTRLQWTNEQLKVMNDILALLPPELKTDLGSFRPKVVDNKRRMSIDENIAIDPSEAVRASEVLPVLKKYFKIVEEKDYGGNVYLSLFHKIMGNFRDDHPLSQTIIRLILYIEDLALQSGTFKSSDFKYIIAQPL